jgi:hypothetical protein
MNVKTWHLFAIMFLVTAGLTASTGAQQQPERASDTVPLAFAQRIAQVGGPPMAQFAVGTIPPALVKTYKIPTPPGWVVVGTVIRPRIQNYSVYFDAPRSSDVSLRYVSALRAAGWRIPDSPSTQHILCLGVGPGSDVQDFDMSASVSEVIVTIWERQLAQCSNPG